jgi:hypothetical protein
MTPTLASVTGADLGIWAIFMAGGIALEYFVGIVRRFKPHD